jgi:hypothetical protein
MRMGTVLRGSRLLAAVFLTMGVLAACGDDDGGGPVGPQPVDLSGTYVLQSISVGGQPVDGTIGELVLTATTYTVTIDWPDVFPQEDVNDNGTYQAFDDGTWSQNSATGQPDVQGTWTLVGNTFTVSIVGIVETENVWLRQ